MMEQQQAAALAFLTDPATHGVAAAAITIIKTHISIVVLAGNRGYKLKRAAAALCRFIDAGIALRPHSRSGSAHMDLWHRGLTGAANLVFNPTFDARDDADGLSLLPFFMALRAAVRAQVGATAAESAVSGRRDGLAAEAQACFALAETLLVPRLARLVAIGGFSGSGKSTVAARIAGAIGPPPNARLLASDRLRKQPFGVAPETRLPEAAYRPEVSEPVYRRLYDDAAAAFVAGHAALADAVFERADTRRRIAEVAARAAVLPTPPPRRWRAASGDIGTVKISVDVLSALCASKDCAPQALG